jgi:hypothetical protein
MNVFLLWEKCFFFKLFGSYQFCASFVSFSDVSRADGFVQLESGVQRSLFQAGADGRSCSVLDDAFVEQSLHHHSRSGERKAHRRQSVHLDKHSRFQIRFAQRFRRKGFPVFFFVVPCVFAKVLSRFCKVVVA